MKNFGRNVQPRIIQATMKTEMAEHRKMLRTFSMSSRPMWGPASVIPRASAVARAAMVGSRTQSITATAHRSPGIPET